MPKTFHIFVQFLKKNFLWNFFMFYTWMWVIFYLEIGLNLKAYDILTPVSTIKCLHLSGGKEHHDQLGSKALLPPNVSCFQWYFPVRPEQGTHPRNQWINHLLLSFFLWGGNSNTNAQLHPCSSTYLSRSCKKGSGWEEVRCPVASEELYFYFILEIHSSYYNYSQTIDLCCSTIQSNKTSLQLP